MPKVSVIIPVYNVEKYLSQCLDSVVNQTLKDIEIICIDDGSTDNSLEILKTYAQKDSRIKILTQQNSGAGAARNLGLKKASGQYLYFMDSDDFISAELVEKMYSKIREHVADICVCQNNTFNDNTQEYKNCNWAKDIDLTMGLEVFNKYDIPLNLFQFCNIPTQTKLYRTDFVKDNKIKFQEIKICNDVFFNFYSLAMAEKIVMLKEELATYRQGHANLTRNRGNHINCILEAFSKLRRELKRQKLFKLLQDTMYKRARACFNYETHQLDNQKKKDYWTLKLYNFLPKKYWTKSALKLKNEKSIIKKIFSIQNVGIHKVICILGIKLKIKSKKLVERRMSKSKNSSGFEKGV